MVSFRRYLVASVFVLLACIMTSLSAEELTQSSVKVAFPKYFPPPIQPNPRRKAKWVCHRGHN